jgi:anti-anti-sigma factor
VTELARVELEQAGSATVARIVGEVDLSNARSLELEIAATVPNEAAALVLDLSETTYLDSAGIRLVFGLADAVRRRGQELRLVVPETSPVHRILELSCVQEVAPFSGALADALAPS